MNHKPVPTAMGPAIPSRVSATAKPLVGELIHGMVIA